MPACIILLVASGCSSPSPEAIPTAPIQFSDDQELAVVRPTPAPAEVAPPEDPPPATSPEPELLPEAPVLVESGQIEPLQLLAEIPIPRADFGVRLTFSPSEDILLHSGTGLRIEQFALAGTQILDDITGFENFSPFTISPSPDGTAIVADDGPSIHVWEAATGKLIQTLELSPFSTIINAGFYAGDIYFAVDYNGNVGLWDSNGWGEISRFTFSGRIDAGFLFPDADAVALQDRNRGEIVILNLLGEQLGVVPLVDENPAMLAISPQGDRILLHVNRGLPSEGVKIVDTDSGETLLELPMLNYRHFAVSPNWELLAAMDVFNHLRMYALPQGELLLEQELDVARTRGLSMSPTNNYLAVYAHKGEQEGAAIQIWGRGEN